MDFVEDGSSHASSRDSCACFGHQCLHSHFQDMVGQRVGFFATSVYAQFMSWCILRTRSAVTTNMMDVGQRKGDDGSKRRDKDGFIVFDDLENDTSGKDVSQVIDALIGQLLTSSFVHSFKTVGDHHAILLITFHSVFVSRSRIWVRRQVTWLCLRRWKSI